MDFGRKDFMRAADGGEVTGRGPVTNCVRCDKWIAGPGPALCDDCKAEGFELCRHCGTRVSNGTTPYCDVCAEEIVGAG
jgi:RecJ-like exonuclease